MKKGKKSFFFIIFSIEENRNDNRWKITLKCENCVRVKGDIRVKNCLMFFYLMVDVGYVKKLMKIYTQPELDDPDWFCHHFLSNISYQKIE